MKIRRKYGYAIQISEKGYLYSLQSQKTFYRSVMYRSGADPDELRSNIEFIEEVIKYDNKRLS